MKKKSNVYSFSDMSVLTKKEKPAPKKKLKKQKKVSSGLSIFRWGSVVEIDGVNQMRLIERLKKEGVKMRRITKSSSQKMSLTLSENDCQKTFAILQDMCYNYKVTKTISKKNLFSWLVQNAALMFTLIFFSCLYAYFYGFIWHIEITGVQNGEVALIENTLKSHDISFGKSKKNVDKTKVRNLLNSLESVLDASVEIQGVTLKISIVEPTVFVPTNDGSTSGIVSRYDAQITKIVALSGTPLVSVGDRVFAGAELIAPYRLDPEQNEIPLKASGEVYGEVVFSAGYEFSLSEKITQRTGKTETAMAISFRQDKPVYKKSSFALCEIVRSSGYLFENFFIPLKYNKAVFYELESIEKAYTLDERIQHYVSLATDSLVINAGGAPINTKTYLEKTEQDSYKLYVYIAAEILISI